MSNEREGREVPDKSSLWRFGRVNIPAFCSEPLSTLLGTSHFVFVLEYRTEGLTGIGAHIGGVVKQVVFMSCSELRCVVVECEGG